MNISISPEDTDKFHRLGVGSVTALALIAPTSFEDRRLSTQLNINAACVIDATVESVSTHSKNPQNHFFCPQPRGDNRGDNFPSEAVYDSSIPPSPKSLF